MNIQSLKNFYDVATLRSISKVALLSHISQSALSQQLLRLEEELGVQLLERSNKGVELTKEGQLILKHVKTIIKAYERIIDDISIIKRNKDSTFAISSPSSSINSVMLKAIINLKDKYKNYSFKLTSMIGNSIESELDNDFADIILTYEAAEREDIVSLKVGSDELVFVTNPEIDLKGPLSFEDIFKYSFILLKDGPDIKRLLHLALASQGYDIDDLNIVFTANSIDIGKNSVYGAPTISLLPKISVEKDISSGLMKEIKIKGASFNYEVFLSFKHETYKHLKSLIDDFKKQAKSLFK
ncbi:LysR family transcriptional regulator [Clostridium sp. CX1]|uniref:LysR family transcriptional regulator n=1 Tax=Clostridium sp. CX1 TaxID=2978346 RepID=UPI0021BEC293|nr:LysR family transcriptional regulator [Clostridium sp. CX1]MCT8978618.1 LysR family transcriptional regulator [Clostridium sp. CX1]